jgi:hypothetical protein
VDTARATDSRPPTTWLFYGAYSAYHAPIRGTGHQSEYFFVFFAEIISYLLYAGGWWLLRVRVQPGLSNSCPRQLLSILIAHLRTEQLPSGNLSLYLRVSFRAFDPLSSFKGAPVVVDTPSRVGHSSPKARNSARGSQLKPCRS